MSTTPTFEYLIVKAVDGCLTPEETLQFEALLEKNPVYREEYEDHLYIKATTDQFTQRILASARVDPPRESEAVQTQIKAGTGLVVVGLLTLIGFALWTFFGDNDVPLITKAGVALVVGGSVILSAHVLKKWWLSRAHDPYKEIDR